MTPTFVDWPRGLGDNIYVRPFIRALAERADVWLNTPWPEVFEDLPVKFVRPNSELRTQALNEIRNASLYVDRAPRGPSLKVIRPGYGQADFRKGNIVEACERYIPLDGAPLVMDLPDSLGPNPIRANKPIAVVRPVTVRSEWANEARNPLPEYVDWIAQDLCRTHHVVALAHLAPRKEWALSTPWHHTACLHGELTTRQILALVRDADIVVGGVGWIVPAAIALKTRAFIVLGGQGGQNAPDKITDPRLDLSRIGWAWPDQMCGCEEPKHACAKTISNLPEQWGAWRTACGI